MASSKETGSIVKYSDHTAVTFELGGSVVLTMLSVKQITAQIALGYLSTRRIDIKMITGAMRMTLAMGD
jgi:hypothetical protein